MSFEDPAPISLGGSLLLADPSLKDPNFFRTVLYMSHHTLKAGAEGFVLNRPMGKTVQDLMLATDVPGLGEVQVYAGGPVGVEHLIFASLYWNEEAGQLDFNNRLSAAQAAAQLQEGFEVRAFVGYAGWLAGQLEGELRERSWIPYRADAQLLGRTPQALWRETLEAMSPWHYLLSKTPEDPSLN